LRIGNRVGHYVNLPDPNPNDFNIAFKSWTKLWSLQVVHPKRSEGESSETVEWPGRPWVLKPCDRTSTNQDFRW
jgi:hypothetical protein